MYVKPTGLGIKIIQATTDEDSPIARQFNCLKQFRELHADQSINIDSVKTVYEGGYIAAIEIWFSMK